MEKKEPTSWPATLEEILLEDQLAKESEKLRDRQWLLAEHINAHERSCRAFWQSTAARLGLDLKQVVISMNEGEIKLVRKWK